MCKSDETKKMCVCERERERENGIGLNVYKLKRWEYDLKDSQHVFHFQICFKFKKNYN